MLAPTLMSVGTVLVDYVKNREMNCKCNPMESEMGMMEKEMSMENSMTQAM